MITAEKFQTFKTKINTKYGGDVPAYIELLHPKLTRAYLTDQYQTRQEENKKRRAEERRIRELGENTFPSNRFLTVNDFAAFFGLPTADQEAIFPSLLRAVRKSTWHIDIPEETVAAAVDAAKQFAENQPGDPRAAEIVLACLQPRERRWPGDIAPPKTLYAELYMNCLNLDQQEIIWPRMLGGISDLNNDGNTSGSEIRNITDIAKMLLEHHAQNPKRVAEIINLFLTSRFYSARMGGYELYQQLSEETKVELWPNGVSEPERPRYVIIQPTKKEETDHQRARRVANEITDLYIDTLVKCGILRRVWSG